MSRRRQNCLRQTEATAMEAQDQRQATHRNIGFDARHRQITEVWCKITEKNKL